MNSFYTACDRLADIVPPLRGSSHPCGEGMIEFCRWCESNFKIAGGEKFIQDLVLDRMTPEEIQSAYARWVLEKEE